MCPLLLPARPMVDKQCKRRTRSAAPVEEEPTVRHTAYGTWPLETEEEGG